MKIYSLHLNKDQRKFFDKEMEEVTSKTTVEHLNDFKELKQKLTANIVLFYGHVSSVQTLEEDLEKIHELDYFVCINIIFFKQNFNALAKAFHYNINHILNKKYTSENIRRALLKYELKELNENKSSIRAMEYLLETPIKIKNDLQMYHYLNNYFNHLNGVKFFTMFRKNGSELEYLFGNEQLETKEVIKNVKQLEYPEKAIGKVFKLDENDDYCFPIYKENEDLILGVAKLDLDTQDVFSELFLKFLRNVHLYRKVKEKANEMTELANKDEVTGLFNQRKLTQDLEDTIREHEEEEKTFSVMFIDVDHFKKVNDLYGHVVGSQMLIEIGQVLRSLLRDSDSIYRYGGDEFVVIMTDVKTDIVHKVALRILNSVKEKEFKIENGDTYRLSISIGIAEYPKNAKSAKELIGFADEMMYESKKSGRGKVYHLEEVANASSSSK